MVWKLGKSLCEKVMTKRRCKKEWSSSVHWQKFHQNTIPEKRWHILFWKKATGISRFVVSPLEILNKTKLFIPNKSCKIIWHLLEMKPNSLCFFSLLPLKILVISCLAPGNFTLYFFNIPGKSKSWNSQFHDFTWTDKLLIMKF